MLKASKQLLSQKSHIVILSAAISILLIIGGYFYFIHNRNIILSKNNDDIKAIAESKIDQIVRWHKERTGDVSTISTSPLIINTIEKLNQNYKNDKTISDVKKRLSSVQELGEYETILLTTVQGEILLSVGTELSILDKAISAKIIRSVENQKITFTDFYYCPTHNNIHYDIIAPIINDKNQNVAAILFRINPNDYLYPFIQSWPTPSKTAETILFEKDGDSVLYLHELRHQKNTALKFRVSLTRKELPTVQAVLGKTGYFAGKDYRGIDVLAYLAPVPGTNWYMEAKVDRDEVLSDLKFQGIAISLFVFILISALIVGLMWIYHYRQRNIYKTLFETQEEFKTTLYSIGDAVITTDKKGRVKHFNQIAEQLTGFTEAFAIGKKLEEVFKIINEGTRNSVENPVQKVLKNGVIIGLANHTLLISNDGREIPIADSGAPIRNENGEIIGVVLVFRDQTEERKSQKIIFDSETKYRRLFEASRDGILILDAATGKIADVNPYLIEILGYPKSRFIDKTLWEIGSFKDIVANREKFLELQQKEYVRYEDLPLETASGQTIDVEFVSNVYTVNSHKVVQCNIRNITERKRTEKEIIHLNRLYAMLSQSNQAIVRLKNSDELFKDICRVAIESGEFKLAWVGLFDNQSNKIIPYNWHGFEDGFLQKELAGAPDEMRNLMPCIRAYKENHIVVKNDVATDPDCEYWRNGALKRNFKSLAAAPIHLFNDVIGVFVLYSSETNFFGEKETNLLHEIGIDISFALETYDKEEKRIKAEITLNESESKLRNIFEHSTNLFYSHDANHVLNYVSPQVKDILGYEAEEVLIKWTEFVSDNPINEIGFQKTVKAIETGETQEPYELELVHKSGRKVWVEVREAPLVENGKTISIVGSLTDITERKRAEEAIKVSEENLRVILESTNDGILAINKEGKVIKANNQFAKLWRIPKEILGTKDDNLFLNFVLEQLTNPTEFINKVRALYNSTESSYDTIHFKDGRIFERLSNPLISDELPIGRVWSFRDITERMRTDEKLMESERKYSDLYENAPDMYLSVEPKNGTIIFCNNTLAKVTGYTKEELIGKPLIEMYHPDSYKDYKNNLTVLKETGIITNTELKVVKKDGTAIDVSLSTTAVRDDKGNILHSRSVWRDITKRKLAEKALHDSEKRYHSLFDRMMDGVYRSTHEGRFVDVNPAMVQMFGFSSREEMLKVDIKKDLYFDPSERDSLFMDTGLERKEIFRMRHKDGSEIWVEDHGSYIHDEKGNVILHEGIVRDVTARLLAENELKRSEEKYKDIFIWAPVGIYQSSIDGKIITANQRLASILGYDSSGDLIDRDMGKEIYYNEEERQKLIEQNKKSEHGSVTNLEILWKKKNESPIWVMLTAHAIKYKSGKTIYYEGFVHDITERKLAEENIRMLSRAMEQSPASIVITDLNGKIEYVNPKFTQLTGYTSAEVLGQNPRILKSGEIPSEEYKQLWGTISLGKEWQGEFHNKKKNGELYWESATISPIKDASGKTTHYLAVKEDITEKKSLHAQLLRSQRIESIGTLAGGVAHDLNNVLAPIMLSIDILKDRLHDERSQRMLETLEASAHRGSAIVKQILGFARGVHGENVLIQFRHIVNEITNIIKETFPKSITIKEDIPKNIWTIVGDPTNLHQVLLNLCVNARDAMPNGGLINIIAENKIIDEQFSAMNPEAKPGQYVMIGIEDTGCGMPPAVLEHIFEPFFTTKEVGKGTGLGLSTVHAIVKSHRGFVNVHSEVGKGTTFSIYLPAAKESGEIKPKSEILKEMFLGQGELIMVVDDESSIQQITKQTLETYGYRVVTACDGTEAIAHFATKSDEIALVLTDMIMPVMDGAKTIQVLRKMNPEIKIIASSGLGVKDDLVVEQGLLVDAFLIKPYDSEKLLATVHSVLHKK